MSRPALGLIETEELAGAIEATHAATCQGDVVIASLERSEAGFIIVKLEGELDAVQKAVQAGARAAEKAGQLISMHIIPRTDNGLSPMLPYQRFVARYHPDLRKDRRQQRASGPRRSYPGSRETYRRPAGKVETEPPPPSVSATPASPPSVPPPARQATLEQAQPDLSDLESMPVVKLRRYARTIKDLPIQGRQISLANKQSLLEAIRSVLRAE